ncbi:MAG TPA: hypothetical protein VEZ40_00645 [Pyrinomonadaceae bacterium]|nr:hypothetical protein [Pyrinomonadaceae bacterium]
MADENQSPRLFSLRTARALHFTLAALALILFVFQLWSWARLGQGDWTRFLMPLGFLIVGVGGIADPAFGRQHQALSYVGTAVIIIYLIVVIRAL